MIRSGIKENTVEKILIVEDERSISMVLKAYLKKAGYDVEQAYDGNRALALFEEYKPLLVLLDIMLPGMDGWSILKIIRKQSDCPVIILSALNNKEDGFLAGADDYICKPFVAEEVVTKVQQVIDRRRRVQP
jgi:DNA-binding response OmpR family regulator